jgi:hypothetical protein
MGEERSKAGRTGSVLVQVYLENQVLVLCLFIHHLLQTATRVRRDLPPHNQRQPSAHQNRTHTLDDPRLAGRTGDIHLSQGMTEFRHRRGGDVHGDGDGHA